MRHGVREMIHMLSERDIDDLVALHPVLFNWHTHDNKYWVDEDNNKVMCTREYVFSYVDNDYIKYWSPTRDINQALQVLDEIIKRNYIDINIKCSGGEREYKLSYTQAGNNRKEITLKDLNKNDHLYPFTKSLLITKLCLLGAAHVSPNITYTLLHAYRAWKHPKNNNSILTLVNSEHISRHLSSDDKDMLISKLIGNTESVNI